MALSLTGSPPVSAAALDAAVNAELTANWAPLASPPLSGAPTAPTVAATSAAGTTQLATTAFVRNGTTTNDNAQAGQVGEFISSAVLIGAAVPLTTSVTANVTSISLTAGDWDVSGNISFSAGGSTVITGLYGGVNTVSATLPNTPDNGSYVALGLTFTTGGNNTLSLGPARISVASTTTVYLVCNQVFATSTLAAFGLIRARRVR